MTSVCQLNDYQFRKLDIQFVDTGEAKEIEIEHLTSKFDYDVWRNPDDSSVYMMRFSAEFHEESPQGERLGYQIETEIFGTFTLSDKVEASKRGTLIRQNGVSILLGIVRGQIGMNTGSFLGGKLLIPTLMPQDIVERIESNKKAVKSVAKKRPAKRASPKKTARKKLAASKKGKG